jgi:hypothetical protein
MTRKRRPLFDTSRRRLLEPNGIPSDLLARGWNYRTPECASRLDAAGRPTAWAHVDIQSDDDGGLFVAWLGASFIPRRKLRDIFTTAHATMAAVEAAEADGPHSGAWGGQSGPPQRVGWQHTVRSGRDAWWCLTPEGRQMVVLQRPAPRDRCGGLLYTAWIDGVCIGRDGEPRQFGNPVDALIEAEYEAGLDGATISARSIMALTE